MLEKKIHFQVVDDIAEFVRAAEKCEYEVAVISNTASLDAKSIIGVMSMDLSEGLTVQYRHEDRDIETVLDKFAVEENA